MSISLNNEDAKFIHKATKVFHESQWEEFSILKLGFDYDEIKKLQAEHKDKSKKLKYETVNVWLSKENEENLEKLTALKLEYFFSKSETIFSKSVEAQQDLDGGKSNDELRYPLKNGKGIALIIGNSFVDTEGHSSRKPGCDRDLEKMKELWSETLRCELVDDKVHSDKTADEMRELLEKVAKKENIDYAVVVISTHGGFVEAEEIIDQKTEIKTGENQETKLIKYEEILYGNDGSKLQASEFQKILCNKEAQPLRDIPKLLILQYCRGEKIDKGVSKDTTDAGVFSENQKTELFTYSYPVDALMPEMSDIITVYATHQEFMALRNKKDGSWMIGFIYDVFRIYYKTKHVTDMLTIVNNQMKNRSGKVEGEDCKAMSIYESSLTKDFYLV
uniref:caspase-2-like n=1 Tax=Styela clava TaxID=7725 RepID=UPI001939A6A0|nr:caspase-2-like [Styela clava]